MILSLIRLRKENKKCTQHSLTTAAASAAAAEAAAAAAGCFFCVRA